MFQLYGFGMPGWQELLVVALIALLLFGGRLPKIMHDLGGSISSFRKGLNEASAEQANPQAE